MDRNCFFCPSRLSEALSKRNFQTSSIASTTSSGTSPDGSLPLMIDRISSRSSMGGTQISVNLLRRAGDSSLFPKSPPGFMVARRKNPSLGMISSTSSLPFSDSVTLPPTSSTEFNRSSTASSARESSSTRIKSPFFMAVTRGPSTHSKGTLISAWHSRNVSSFGNSFWLSSAGSLPKASSIQAKAFDMSTSEQSESATARTASKSLHRSLTGCPSPVSSLAISKNFSVASWVFLEGR